MPYANPEQQREYDHDYYLRHRERIVARKHRYHKEHKEKHALRDAAWTKANPEKQRAKERRRQILKTSAKGSFTAEEWQALCENAGNRCLCCGSLGPLETDHIIPLSRGGSNDISNIQPLCGVCNRQKHTKIINYWEVV